MIIHHLCGFVKRSGEDFQKIVQAVLSSNIDIFLDIIDIRYYHGDRKAVVSMPRSKFQTLTEQMFYVLLALRQERCGADISDWVRTVTRGRVAVGPGTLYSLLESFVAASLIRETRVEGRRRSYLITVEGERALEGEYRRLLTLTEDYRAHTEKKEDGHETA